MLGSLGIVLLYMALGLPGGTMSWRLLLLVLGAGALTAALAMNRATSLALELTAAELRDSAGTVLARVDNIARVDRGTFAFKPSNGFVLHLAAKPGPRLWRPGVYWRFGRRIGVGGILQAAQTKQMADALAIMIAERQAADQG